MFVSSIRVKKYSSEASALFKYCETIREMANLHRGLAWRYYDLHFRNPKITDLILNWDNIYQEIWSGALLEPNIPAYGAVTL